LKPWDSAALFPIIEEAGGVFTNKNGERTGLGGSAIATNKQLADRIREILSPTPKAFSKLDLDALDFQKSNGWLPSSRKMRAPARCSWSRTPIANHSKKRANGRDALSSRSRGLWHKGATKRNTQRWCRLTKIGDGDAKFGSA